MKRHQKPVVFKYRVLIVIYYSHVFLYIKFSLRVLNNLLLYIYIYNKFTVVFFLFPSINDEIKRK